MTIIDGKECAKKLRAKIKEFVQGIYEENNIRPKLVVIQVGNNEASNRYVRNKERACEEVGIISETKHFDENTQAWELIAEIEKLNEDDSVNGILVQLPLPESLSDKTDLILSTISADKDVDGFRDVNVGRLAKNDMNYFPACTPSGIMYLLKEYNIDVDGRHCVILGRSNIVGKPMAMMLLNKNATVTICHSHTYDLKDITTQADILISAVGKPNFVTADMVKRGAAVIDVGINSVDGKLCGDVCKEVEKKASYLTPVPGGVGPMTIAMLLKNTVDSFWRKFHKTEDPCDGCPVYRDGWGSPSQCVYYNLNYKKCSNQEYLDRYKRYIIHCITELIKNEKDEDKKKEHEMLLADIEEHL